MLRLRPLLRRSTSALTTLITMPTAATISTPPPSTSAGLPIRCSASKTIHPDAASNASPFTSAPSTSARSRPNVRRAVDGRDVSVRATKCDRQRGDVGEHVRGVGEQRERMEGKAARDLHDEERTIDHQGDDKSTALAGADHRVIVLVSVHHSSKDTD